MTIPDQPQIKDANLSLEIRVLTFNVWGIPHISSDKKERIAAIGDFLSQTREAYHYVFLQEIWSREDFAYVADKVSKVLPYSHFFSSGVMGSGTCILSSTPLLEVHFHPFSLNGYAHKILHGDWYGGKGVSFCRTTFQGIPVQLVNTHLHADYGNEEDEYVCHQVVQAYELSQLVRFSSGADRGLTIIAGDLNSTTTQVPYRLLVYNTDVVDAYYDSPIKSVDGVGATNEAPGNSYTTAKALQQNPNGSRIDYIFFKASKLLQVKTVLYDQPLPHRVPLSEFSFSDHEAVRAVLNVRISDELEERGPSVESSACFGRTDALLDASAVTCQGLRSVCKRQKRHSWIAFALFLLLVMMLGLSFNGPAGAGVFFLALFTALIANGIVYCVYVALISTNLEYNGLTAAKAGLDRLLNEVRQKNARHFELLKDDKQ